MCRLKSNIGIIVAPNRCTAPVLCPTSRRSSPSTSRGGGFVDHAPRRVSADNLPSTILSPKISRFASDHPAATVDTNNTCAIGRHSSVRRSANTNAWRGATIVGNRYRESTLERRVATSGTLELCLQAFCTRRTMCSERHLFLNRNALESITFTKHKSIFNVSNSDWIPQKKKKSNGSAPGFEPGTSSTLRKNHTPRPRGHLTYIPKNIYINSEDREDFAKVGKEKGRTKRKTATPEYFPSSSYGVFVPFHQGLRRWRCR